MNMQSSCKSEHAPLGGRRAAAIRLAIALLLLSGSYGAHAVKYVDNNPAVPGPRNGTSWATAYANIQTAVNAAVPFEEIWVANGTYEEGRFTR